MKQKIVNILKKTNLYIPLKMMKDKINYLLNKNKEGERLYKFYKEFLKKDDLIFDVGANIGDRTEVFSKFGKVVSVEPVSRCVKILNKRFFGNPRVSIEHKGIGDKNEIKEIRICNASEFSTFSDDQLKTMGSLEKTKNIEWYKKEKVQITTLNDLIKKYGLPNFCKIDVEGYENEALAGLDKKIPLISFEYNTLFKEKAIKCVEKMALLGNYEFNYSEKETLKFALEKWVSKKEIIDKIKNLQDEFSFGDIYARLK